MNGATGALHLQWLLVGILLTVALPLAAQNATETTPTASAPPPASQTQNGAAAEPVKPARQPSSRERNRAAKLFLQASKDVQTEHYEEAVRLYKQAVHLDPANENYPLAMIVARNHAVTALIQQAAKMRAQDDTAGARQALAKAWALDPTSQQVATHMNDLGDQVTTGFYRSPNELASRNLGETPELDHSNSRQSFHLRASAREVIQKVYKAWGIDTTFDSSVSNNLVRLNIDDASFSEAVQMLRSLTQTFDLVLDPHRVVVAHDSKENRQRLERQNLETIYFSGLGKEALDEISKLAKDIFGISSVSIDSSQNTITLRSATENLSVFNSTLRSLLVGSNQVALDMRVIQLAHTHARDTGTQIPQSYTAYNLYAEEESLISSNQTTVNEIVSAGLASATDKLTILALLVAGGEVSGSLFENGLLTFGGGIAESAFTPGSATTFNLAVNSSDTKALDHVLLHLGDGEEGKLRLGERYPIQTSTYSSLVNSSSSSVLSGTSSTLSSLLASYGSTATTPMIEYQDIGLTLKATPRIMRSGDVSLILDLKIDALSGSSLNAIPILNSRSYSGVVTARLGETIVVAQEISKTQSRAVSGTPGLSDIPGLNKVFSDTDKETDTSTLLIVLTPHVLRFTQSAGHTPMMRVEKIAAIPGK